MFKKKKILHSADYWFTWALIDLTRQLNKADSYMTLIVILPSVYIPVYPGQMSFTCQLEFVVIQSTLFSMLNRNQLNWPRLLKVCWCVHWGSALNHGKRRQKLPMKVQIGRKGMREKRVKMITKQSLEHWWITTSLLPHCGPLQQGSLSFNLDIRRSNLPEFRLVFQAWVGGY